MLIGSDEKIGYPSGGSADCTVKFLRIVGCACIL